MKNTVLLTFFTILALPTFSQDFLPAFDRFSSKEPATIILKDGSKVEGLIDDIDRKKGLIEEITIQTDKKKKTDFEAEKIKEMYLPASGWSKSMQVYDKTLNLSRSDNKTDMKKISEGYGFFEQSEVMIKKDKRILLLQLVNPSFDSKIKVYHDPWAAETMSVGFGGFKVAGGDDKSYFVKKADAPAFKLYKKNYDEEFSNLFGDCPAFTKTVKEIKWSHFASDVIEYSKTCPSK